MISKIVDRRKLAIPIDATSFRYEVGTGAQSRR